MQGKPLGEGAHHLRPEPAEQAYDMASIDLECYLPIFNGGAQYSVVVLHADAVHFVLARKFATTTASLGCQDTMSDPVLQELYQGHATEGALVMLRQTHEV